MSAAVLTLAGFGGPPAVGEPFLPRVAKGLVEYVDERRLKSPIVVGHSLGGGVVFAYGVGTVLPEPADALLELPRAIARPLDHGFRGPFHEARVREPDA